MLICDTTELAEASGILHQIIRHCHDLALCPFCDSSPSLRMQLAVLLLHSECLFFHDSLRDLKTDVRYDKKQKAQEAKWQKKVPPLAPELRPYAFYQPRPEHPIGTTEPELRAAAGEHKT